MRFVLHVLKPGIAITLCLLFITGYMSPGGRFCALSQGRQASCFRPGMSSQEQLTRQLCIARNSFAPALFAYGLFINIVAKAFFIHFSMPLGSQLPVASSQLPAPSSHFCAAVPCPGLIPGRRQLAPLPWLSCPFPCCLKLKFELKRQ